MLEVNSNWFSIYAVVTSFICNFRSQTPIKFDTGVFILTPKDGVYLKVTKL